MAILANAKQTIILSIVYVRIVLLVPCQAIMVAIARQDNISSTKLASLVILIAAIIHLYLLVFAIRDILEPI
jgi:hypothetical protein